MKNVATNNPLKILLIEDSNDDAEVLEEELEISGLSIACKRVENDVALLAELDAEWDVVLSDYVVPDMDWQRSLELVRKHHPEIPFIIVSGNRGEEFAVETMRAGCNDYIVKDRLMRLGPAIEREVEASKERQRVNAARRSLEEELQRTRKLEATGRLASGLAHNLNNILTVIMGGLDIVLIGGQFKEDARYLEEATRAVEQAAKMVRQLARLGLDLPFDPGVVRPDELISRITSLVAPVLPGNISFTQQCDSAIPAIVADSAQLEQALLNLVLNARDAMPEGGTISLSVKIQEENKSLVLAVADEGHGIEQELQERIFEPFFSTKGDGGTGIGLATVFNIARAHDGRVRIDSTPGLGSVFELVLPIELANQERDSSALPAWPKGKGKIFVVDDAEDVIIMAGGILKQCGYEVLSAGSFQQAKEHLSDANSAPDLIIADVVMSGGGARDLLQWLGAHEIDIPVLVTSGFETEKWGKYRIYEGFAGFLRKPFKGADLATLVAQNLN